MFSQKSPGKSSQKHQKEQHDPYGGDFYRRSLSTFDLDDSDIGNYSMLQRTASVMITDSHDRNSILGYPTSPPGRVMDKKKMKDVDVKFVDKSTWKKENVCSVCERSVDTGGRGRHHCRVCASTVCGSCSLRRINKKRVCDTCFYKKRLEVQERKMDETLTRMEDTAKETMTMLKRTKEGCEQERAKCRQLEAQIQEEFSMQEESQEKQRKVKYGFLNNLNKAKEINQNLTSGIEKNKTLIAEKESKLRSLKTKLATLSSDITQKTQKYKEMTQTFESLLQKHRTLNEGRSESVVSETPRNAVLAKNYSLLGNDNNQGKYNISVQPMKI